MSKFEHISRKALVLWEILAFFIATCLITAILLIFIPRTWLWYLLIFTIGLIYIIVAFLYLPLYYLNFEFCIKEDQIILRKGVVFPSVNILSRKRIAFVTSYNTPLTPIFHISSMAFSATGGNIYIGFIDTKRAKEITHEFNKRVR